jgi:hypothetical protein
MAIDPFHICFRIVATGRTSQTRFNLRVNKSANRFFIGLRRSIAFLARVRLRWQPRRGDGRVRFPDRRGCQHRPNPGFQAAEQPFLFWDPWSSGIARRPLPNTADSCSEGSAADGRLAIIRILRLRATRLGAGVMRARMNRQSLPSQPTPASRRQQSNTGPCDNEIRRPTGGGSPITAPDR